MKTMKIMLQHVSTCNSKGWYFLVAILLLSILPQNGLFAAGNPRELLHTEAGDFPNTLLSVVVGFSKNKEPDKSKKTEEMAFAVEGTVTDESNGETIPGVNILVKDSNIGTVTDIEGNYKITVPDESSILTFSYIGYSTQEVAVNGRSTINVVMSGDVSDMEEVIVVGYGKKKKINLLGAVSAISSEELGNQSITSAGQALMGRVAGVQMIQPSAQPGKDAPTINIRGVNTIRQSADGQIGDTSPLVIIDGVQATMVDVHPQDIESITVLKDASSAAIYGARAANGVILITTKRGLPKKPSISINSY